MSSVRLVFSSDGLRALSELAEGDRGVVSGVRGERPDSYGDGGPAERLAALGVTAGARVTVLQTFPGVVFLCDQTELVVERAIAHTILIRTAEEP